LHVCYEDGGWRRPTQDIDEQSRGSYEFGEGRPDNLNRKKYLQYLRILTSEGGFCSSEWIGLLLRKLIVFLFLFSSVHLISVG
jgi:hypothetical protein